jgi:hypothetical protein
LHLEWCSWPLSGTDFDTETEPLLLMP